MRVWERRGGRRGESVEGEEVGVWERRGGRRGESVGEEGREKR